MAERHPATTGLLRWFEYDHLPPHLQAVSKPIGDLAHELVEMLPDGPELSTGLRKLLEAKDCLVRAALDVPEPLASTRSAPPVVGRHTRDECRGRCAGHARHGHGASEGDPTL